MYSNSTKQTSFATLFMICYTESSPEYTIETYPFKVDLKETIIGMVKARRDIIDTPYVSCATQVTNTVKKLTKWNDKRWLLI